MSKNIRLSIFIIILFTLLALCAATNYSDIAYAADDNTVELVFVFDEKVLTELLVTEGTIARSPDLEDIADGIQTGYTVEWRFADNRKAEFPYAVNAADSTEGKIFFYGSLVPTEPEITITVCAGTDETTFSYAFGTEPALPEKVFGFTVSDWYLDDDYGKKYTPKIIETPFTLYPLFTDRKITVTVDGEETEVDFGSKLPPKADTATHKFVGYLQNGLPFNGRILSPTALTADFERVKFCVTVVKDDSTKLYFTVGEAIEKDALASYGNKFTLDAAGENAVAFPFTPEDDVNIYAFDETTAVPETPTTQTFAITVISEHAELIVASRSEAGKIISFRVVFVESGFKINSLTISSDGASVPMIFDNTTGRFIMPEGDVTITITFTDSDANNYTNAKIKLTTKEIIAISVTGSALLIAGVTILIINIKKNKDKKKTEKKPSDANGSAST